MATVKKETKTTETKAVKKTAAPVQTAPAAETAEVKAPAKEAVSYTHLDVYKRQDLDDIKWNMRGISCRYYTTTLHKGAFYLPYYVEEMLENVE